MRAAAVCARLAARPPMSNEPNLSAFRTVPRTGVIYVTTEASRRGFHPGDPTWSQPGPGAARDRPAARGAAARGPGRHRRRRSRVRADPRHLGAARGDRRPLQPALPARHAVPVQRRERQRLGRRPRGADARRGQPGTRQPGPLPARLHGLRRAAGHLQGVHGDPHPARGRARLRVHRRRSAPRGRGPRACRRCCCRTRATPPASWCAATRWRAGSRWRASSTARCCWTSSTRTTSGARPAAACPSRAPPATSRT